VTYAVNGYTAANKKVSGTNENFSVGTTIGPLLSGDPPYEGSTPWEMVEFLEMELKFGSGAGAPSHLWTNQPPNGGENHGVRLSTTHFPNGSLEISLRVKIRFSRVTEPLEPPFVFEDTVSVTVDIYNKATFLGTVERWGRTQAESEMTPPPPPHWWTDASWYPSQLASGVLPNAISGLQGMNHVADPSTVSGAKEMRQSQIAPKLKASTAFFTVTHGMTSQNGIRSSQLDDMPWQPNSDPLSVAGMVHIGRGDFPLYNFVVLVCCTGVANGAWNLTSSAFGITYPSPPNQDRCVLAWTGPLDDGCPTTWDGHPIKPSPNQTTFPIWTQKVLAYLSSGYTVHEAARKTHEEDNVFVYPFPFQGTAIQPVRVGDGSTKLKGTYQSPEGQAPCFTITS
jgi:hypothetical protein